MSIQSVPSRRRLASHSCWIQRRELPAMFGSSPIRAWNFVAGTTWSRRPSRALATSSSDAPCEYTSAVSTKFTPPSIAAWMIRTLSAESVFPQAPNLIAPRHRWLTLRPVPPRLRYSIGGTLPLCVRRPLPLGQLLHVGERLVGQPVHVR